MRIVKVFCYDRPFGDDMPSTDDGLARRLRRLVETYTPDGTVGRIALALAAGSVAGVSAFLSTVLFLNPVPLSLLVVPLGAAVGVGAATLALLLLWPVYLSLIGRVDSPVDYGRTVRSRSAEQGTGRSRSATPDPDGPDGETAEALETLRDRYARGDLSEPEFERRLERLLETESVDEARAHVDRNEAETDSRRDDASAPGAASRERETE